MGDCEGGEVVTREEGSFDLLGGGSGSAHPVAPLVWCGLYANVADCVKEKMVVDVFEKGEKEVTLCGGLPASAYQWN